MQIKKQHILIIVLASLLASSLACGPLFGGGEEEVTPVVIGGEEQVVTQPTEEPAETEEFGQPPSSLMASGNVLHVPSGGFDLLYPADWVAGDIQGQTVLLAESQDVLTASESGYPPGAAMGIIFGQAAQFVGEMEEAPTSESLLETMTESFVSGGSGEAGEVEPRQFASEVGAGVPFSLTGDGEAIRGYIATYVNGVQGVVIMAIAPEDQWDEAWPVFEDIMSTIIFYPPEGPAALGESTPIAYGDVVQGTITEVGGQGVWTFDGSTGDLVTISMVGLDASFNDTYLELYGPDGLLLTSDDDSGEGLFALIQGYRLPQPGTYAIVARAFGSDTGTYELSLTVSGGESGGALREIAYGETMSAELTSDESRHYWVFEGSAGDVVSISAVGIGDFDDTFLELYSPDGSMLADDDDSGDGWFALIEDVTLPETGTYEIMVRGFAGAVGQYELTLTGQ
jgi:hypothetical protein